MQYVEETSKMWNFTERSIFAGNTLLGNIPRLPLSGPNPVR